MVFCFPISHKAACVVLSAMLVFCSFQATAKSLDRVGIADLIEESDVIVEVKVSSKTHIGRSDGKTTDCGYKYSGRVLRVNRLANYKLQKAPLIFGKRSLLEVDHSYLLFLKEIKSANEYIEWASGVPMAPLDTKIADAELSECLVRGPSLNYFPSEVWMLQSGSVHFLTGVPKDFPPQSLIKFNRGNNNIVYGARRSAVDVFLKKMKKNEQ